MIAGNRPVKVSDKYKAEESYGRLAVMVFLLFCYMEGLKEQVEMN